MYAKAVATAVFLLVLLGVALWYEPSREELTFPEVADAMVEVGDVLPPLPEGAHDLQMFGHEPPDTLHLRFEAPPDAIEDWLAEAERADRGTTVIPLPHVIDAIVWWHPALRQGGESSGRPPKIYQGYGHWIGVDHTSVYLW